MPALGKDTKPLPKSPARTPVDKSELVECITHDIRSGIFPMGTWLKQIDLEKRYGFNRNDIRRALERLAQMRVVAYVKNRGFHVFPADGREVGEIMDVRVIVETAAADISVENASPADIQVLEGLAGAFSARATTGTMAQLNEANVQFHVALLNLCPNRELVGLANELRNRVPSAPTTQWMRRGRIEQSGREHHAIVAALAARDLPRLKDLITAHILQAQ
jgi:DNA-binding GntR family transcriptional regulator